ncbi:unnamed protein product [Musa banksii]
MVLSPSIGRTSGSPPTTSTFACTSPEISPWAPPPSFPSSTTSTAEATASAPAIGRLPQLLPSPLNTASLPPPSFGSAPRPAPPTPGSLNWLTSAGSSSLASRPAGTSPTTSPSGSARPKAAPSWDRSWCAGSSYCCPFLAERSRQGRRRSAPRTQC